MRVKRKSIIMNRKLAVEHDEGRICRQFESESTSFGGQRKDHEQEHLQPK